MHKRRIFVCIALAVPLCPELVHAQIKDLRAYENAPVGVNQLELAYTYANGNASIDTSLIVAGAEFNLNQGTLDYTRFFSFFHDTAWVKVDVPFAGLNGSVTAT